VLKKIFLGLVLSLVISTLIFAKPMSRATVIALAKQLQQEWVIQDHRLLIVDVQAQKLYVILGHSVKYVYTISTSKIGVGNKAGSNRTPRGMHRFSDKYGDDAPLGTIFKARINTGKVYDFSSTQPEKKDYILSRVLHLRGMEAGLNKGKGVDSFKRCIYIHGTSNEKQIGTPSSKGCIRMKNRDVIDLYEVVKPGDFVYIRA